MDWRALARQHLVVGVDEVGRGCLAGPVCAAAAVLPPELEIPLIRDSKILSEARREELSPWILEHCRVGIGVAAVTEVDELNILQATFLAMRRALEKLGLPPTGVHVVVDGNQRVPGLPPGWLQTTFVQGDDRVAPIAAASVVAKVFRDRLMRAHDVEYPGYGLAQHKGYGTKAHREAIQNLGPTPIHRKSFAGVREHLRFKTTSQL